VFTPRLPGRGGAACSGQWRVSVVQPGTQQLLLQGKQALLAAVILRDALGRTHVPQDNLMAETVAANTPAVAGGRLLQGAQASALLPTFVSVLSDGELSALLTQLSLLATTAAREALCVSPSEPPAACAQRLRARVVGVFVPGDSLAALPAHSTGRQLHVDPGILGRLPEDDGVGSLAWLLQEQARLAARSGCLPWDEDLHTIEHSFPTMAQCGDVHMGLTLLGWHSGWRLPCPPG